MDSDIRLLLSKTEDFAMTEKQKKMLGRIIAAFVLFVALLIAEHTGMLENVNVWIQFVIYLVPYLIIGYDIVYKAVRNISHGQVFDENFLMMVATVGAFGVQEFSEAVAVMLFYQVGELFQSYAVGKSRQSISAMMDICPEYANIEQNGVLTQVDPDDVEVGDIIVIKPGERIPLDGVVIEGESLVDTAALTGESVPRSAKAGDEIISGCVNGSGTLKVKVTKEFDDSTVAKILELVENASSKKAKVENFITKFAKYYTPVVTIGAVVLALVPPLVLGGGFAEWIQRACIFLVISCPCALVISVPMGFFGGIGAASKVGVLVKGSNYLEAVAEMTTIVFDKTGTLTKGEFKVAQIQPQGMTETELLEIAALGEGYSTHPIANSIREAYGKTPDMKRTENANEIAGHGISITVDNKAVLIGNEKLMKKEGIAYTPCQSGGTVVYVACDGKFAGTLVISDTVKDGAKEAISAMKQVGVKKCVMLTGDRKEAAMEVAKELGFSEDVKVVAGAGDNAAAAVGTGTVGDGQCNISLGTSGTIFISSKEFGVDENNALHSFDHADGSYHLMGCMLSAASCNKWWSEEILKTKDFVAEQAPIQKLGENQVFFLPYLMGERSPHNNPDARGVFFGMSMDTTRADMTQAVLEGVAFGLRDSLEVARSLGINIERTKICGGGAKSPLWKKIIANVMDLKVDVPENEEGPSMGGAMLAAVGCGAYPDVETICKKMVKVVDTVEPDPELVAKYEEKYQKFRKLYPTMKELF